MSAVLRPSHSVLGPPRWAELLSQSHRYRQNRYWAFTCAHPRPGTEGAEGSCPQHPWTEVGGQSPSLVPPGLAPGSLLT